jgi:hypothetical protein
LKKLVPVALAILALALTFAALRIWDAVSGDDRRAAIRRQAPVLSAEPSAAGASGSGQEAGMVR